MVHGFIPNLAVVLTAAALATLICSRLRQPVVLGYMLTGFFVGPHLALPIVADPEVIRTLSELGLTLLLFSLGLGFDLRRLGRVASSAGLVAIVEVSLMLWLGYLAGRAFGWTSLECLFGGSILAISSTSIIAKVFEEERIPERRRELVFGILVVEDLLAILLLSGLATLAGGAGLEPADLGRTAARLGTFLAGMLTLGLAVVPRLVRAAVRVGRPETSLVVCVGVCFSAALLGESFGFPLALGAFLAGSLVTESGCTPQIEALVNPLRDVFAAVFFVAVGMSIDPKLLVDHAPEALVLFALVVTGKILAVTVGAFLVGTSVRPALRAGMSLAQIGEFSFLIAGVGVRTGATGEFLYPLAVTVSALTALTTPWLIRAADPVARLVDRRLPKRLQTFGALYTAWLERLRGARPLRSERSWVRKLVRLIALDAACIVAIVLAHAFVGRDVVVAIEARAPSLAPLAPWITRLGTVLLALPFAIGIARCTRALGILLAREAFPVIPGDPGASSRRVLVATLQVAILLAVGVPFLALTQPVLSPLVGTAVLAGVLAILGFTVWKGAADVQGDVRAGAHVVFDALTRQARDPRRHARTGPEWAFPGLGHPRAFTLDSSSPAVGRTLKQLDLRGITGATVVAIRRDEGPVLVPTGNEVLEPGDVLAVAGTGEAVQAAEEVLRGPR